MKMCSRATVRQHRVHCIDAAYCCKCSVVCLSVCLSVCVLVTRMWPTKTTEPIEMPFGELIRVGSRNHVLDGSRDPLRNGAILDSYSAH